MLCICNIPIHEYVKRTYNVHKMFIYNMWILKHKNTHDFFVQVQKFFLPLSLKVFDIRKEMPSLYWLFHLLPTPPPPPTRAAPVAHKFVWPRPGLHLNCLLPSQEPNKLTFLKSQPTLPVHVVIHIPWSYSIWGFYFDISEWHISSARTWTPALMFAPN